MVLDTGGVDDHSFNQASWAGMVGANKANANIGISYVPSSSANDYSSNLAAEVAKRCAATVAVGGLMSDAVRATASANPDMHFAEVDGNPSMSNVYGLQFNTAQSAYLGGYLAAGMSKTGKVATWGGLNIGPVTVYMDGFWEGVQSYNQRNEKNVHVLGWDERNPQGGTFSQSFSDQNKGKQISQTFVEQGADIIFPVAGDAALGAGAAAQAYDGAVSVIWVDTDGCESAAQYCKYILTSVVKNLSGAVQAYLGDVARGDYPTGSYEGNLANHGTGLASYHDFQSEVPGWLTAQLDDVEQEVINGSIKISSGNQPVN
jgi:basic membrane protein A